MNIKVTKAGLKTVGEVSLKVGKSIVVEGTKAVAGKAAYNVVAASFDKKHGGVKALTVDKVLGTDKKKKFGIKGNLFKKKHKEEEVEELAEAVVDVLEVTSEATVKKED